MHSSSTCSAATAMSYQKGTLKDDQQMETDTASASQSEVPAKLAEVTSPTATMLQDIPMELLEHIIIDAIVAELIERKLFRRGWKESAKRVVERLRHVCRRWDAVLTTALFQQRLHQFINNFPQAEICFTMMCRRKFSNCVTVAAMNDEVFVLSHRPHKHAQIEIYACDDLRTRKGSIQLPWVTKPWDMAASVTSNHLYILDQALRVVVVLRIFMERRDFEMSHFMTCSTKLSKICVSADGKLIVYQGPLPSTLLVYDVDGNLQHKVEFVKPISYLCSIISKSNGNFVLVRRTSLTEIDGEGKTVQVYKTNGIYLYGTADEYDRIVTIDDGGSLRLLDAEFNCVDTRVHLHAYQASHLPFYRLAYNKKRNEFVAFETAAFCGGGGGGDGAIQHVTVFNFTERSI